jgi:hypothetical protein
MLKKRRGSVWVELRVARRFDPLKGGGSSIPCYAGSVPQERFATVDAVAQS